MYRGSKSSPLPNLRCFTAFNPTKRFVFSKQLSAPTQASLKTQTYREFVSYVNPGFKWYRHAEVKAEVFQAVVDREIKRLMVFEPPRHGKSEMVSRLLPAYFLYRYPEQWVGLCSYGAELAYDLSRAARDNFQRSGRLIRGDAHAVKHWQTFEGGGMWAAGVGGPIAGKGWHLGIIDDWLKNDKDAASDAIRNGQKDWYTSTFGTREEPNHDGDPDGCLIVAGTRWHEDDLPGWLLQRETDGDHPDHWHIVRFEAIKTETAYSIPSTCTITQDWRKPGEVLCPQRRPLKKLEAQRAKSLYFWEALFQQNPTPREGAFFKVAFIKPEDAAPAILRVCRCWDLAGTTDGDFTVGLKLGLDQNDIWWILDMVRGQWLSDERDAVMLQAAALDGKRCLIHIPQDPGQAGIDQKNRLTKMLKGYRVRSSRPTGSKIIRADAAASQVNAGNFRMITNMKWNPALIEELRTFPLGKNDDIVDALADGVNVLSAGGKAGAMEW